MSNGLDTGEQPYDGRFDTAVDKERLERIQAPIDGEHENPFDQRPLEGEHIGNDHQEPVFRPVERFRAPEDMPRRNTIIAEHNAPSFGPGLNWVASAAWPTRPDLVNFDWSTAHPYENTPLVSNIELRTIYAHLLETAGRIRAEMRERQMQVDL